MLNVTPGDWKVYEDPTFMADYPITAMRRLGEVVTIAFCKNKDDALLMAKSKEMYDFLDCILETLKTSESMPDLQIQLKKFLSAIDGRLDYE